MRTAPSLFLAVSAALLSFAGAQDKKPGEQKKAVSLRELHKKHRTELMTRPAPPAPPQGVSLELTSYKSPAGQLHAYISPDPGDGKKHPVILWLIGGFSNSISEESWAEAPPANDQSAVQYRKAGVPMMYPSLRGGNNNPGDREGLFGEVDDVIAAGQHAAKLPWVDPSRIYLGGHSTGGTLALLVAGNTGIFRAVISIEPVHSVIAYGQENLPFDVKKRDELILRAPVAFLPEIKSSTLVLGATEGNIEGWRILQKNCQNPKVQFLEIPGSDHFRLLAPFNEMLGKKISADTGKECALTLSSSEIRTAAARMVKEGDKVPAEEAKKNQPK